jgi:uncharacterized protein (TIGR02001 family)
VVYHIVSKKNFCFSVAAALLAGTVQAKAADMPKKVLPPQAAPPAASVPIDFAFGVRVQSDYNFRGISQSNRNPSPQAYGELQLFDNFLYAGIAGYRVDLPTRPDAEIDLTLGIRPKFGAFTFDLGIIQYYYPGERRLVDQLGGIYTPKNTDFMELAAKVSYNYEDKLILGANIFHAWDWLGSGATGTYASVTAKYNLPFLEGLAASGELGHYWLGRTAPQLGNVELPDYLYWNAGLAYTYKYVTLDLRYHDTNASKRECYTLTTDPKGAFTGSASSKWCSQAFVATLSFDTTLNQLGVFDTK